MIEGGVDPYPFTSKESLQTGGIPEEWAPPISNEQNRRTSILSSGSNHSLATSGYPAVSSGSPSRSLQSRLAQPIATNLEIASSPSNMTNSLPENPRFPPGLSAPPRKPLPAAPMVARLLVPASRWSATTVNSAPSTPAPVSATGVARQNQSRWSSSTTATTVTTESGGSRFSVVPPVPALPVSRLPSSEEMIGQAESTRRNVI